MTRARYFVAVCLIAQAVSGGSQAQALEDALTSHPDPERATYYQRNAEAIGNLRAQITQGDTNARVEALEELASLYPDAAVTTAADLVGDEDTGVARTAARLLADSIVMTDHRMVEANLPGAEYAMARYEAARTALREALDDPRREVREVAAGILASLSDRQALDQINAALQSGVYTEVEAVNYFGLADSDMGAEYIEPYLKQGTKEGREAAVIYLGAIPRYETLVRDGVLLNSEEDASIRAAAARVLSQYDDDFSTYALAVTLDPTLPSELYSSIVEGFLNQSEAKNTLDPTKVRAVKNAIENYEAMWPDADLKVLQQRLEGYEG